MHKFMNNESLTIDLADYAQKNGLKEPQISAFIAANLPTLSLVSETWEKMWESEPTLLHVFQHCRNTNGYVSFFSLYEMAKTIAEKCITSLDRFGMLPIPYQKCNPKRLLTILRYPKRMPLKLATWLTKEAKEKFERCMNHCSEYVDSPDALVESRSRTYAFIHMYKDLIHTWLDEILPPVSYFNEKCDPFSFSPGAVSDACTNPICKWFRAEHAYGNSKPALIPELDPIAHRNPVEEFFRPESLGYGVSTGDASEVRYTICDVYTVKPITVPKQINSVRVVCPESAYFARLQNHIDKQLRVWWKRRGLDKTVFVYGDQDISRKRAYVGSKHATFATIDCTAASDTVHRDLVYAIDHPTLNYFMSLTASTYVWGKDDIKWLEMFGTMGNPLTFDVEMVIFYLIARLAMVIADFGSNHDTAKLSAKRSGIVLVGDDLVVLALYFEPVLDLLEKLHFIPNESKSFGRGYVREACGKEYCNGVDISSIYYPRGLVIDDSMSDARWDGWKEVLTSPLISLVDHYKDLLPEFPDAARVVFNQFAAELDVSFGLDPVGIWNDTITGDSMFRYEGQDVIGRDTVAKTVRNDVVLDIRPNESVMLYSPHVTWVPSEPKRSCWCNDVPQRVLDMLEAEWRMYSGDVDLPVYSPFTLTSRLSMPRANHMRMKPVVTLRLTRHS